MLIDVKRVGWVLLCMSLVSLGIVRPADAAVRYVHEVFGGYTKTADLVYGNAEGNDLRLDLYEPAGDTASKRGVFIWAHGGFFTQGNKLDVGNGGTRSVRDMMTKRGWVVLSIQYRLDPSLPNGFEGYLERRDPRAGLQLLEAIRDAQHDMYAAVRWARKNAATYRLDPDRIATGGFSAGATTSIAVAYNTDDVGSSGNPGYPSHVQAAIGTGTLNAPFLDIHPDPGVEPPVAMFHGADDESPEQAPQTVCAVAKAMLNVCEVHVYQGEGHSSRNGIRDWGAFLYRHVIRKDAQQLRLTPGTLPTIPTVRIPSETIPSLAVV